MLATSTPHRQSLLGITPYDRSMLWEILPYSSSFEDRHHDRYLMYTARIAVYRYSSSISLSVPRSGG